jgi:type 2 lantibiotic biosynthesis protein LanM
VLSRRLSAAALGQEELGAILGGEQLEVDLPAWIDTFRDAFVAGCDSGVSSLGRERGRPLPFEELFTGAIGYARGELRTRSVSVDVLARSAARQLERALLEHLTFVASGPVGQEFYEFRIQRAPLSVFEDRFCTRPRTTEVYEAFLEQMRPCGLLRLLGRYPVLARLLAQGVDQWVRTIADLCDRYLADVVELERVLDADLSPVEGSIVAARPDLSDRHDGGATAVALTLANGCRVVYKPRGAGGELAWAAVLAWLNERQEALTLTSPRILDRGSHHWSEWVQPGPCTTAAEVETFHVRSGATLAALNLLAATDIHADNLIACGDQPVVVDLEMVLNPVPHPASVDRTGMLPSRHAEPEGPAVDLSALGADADHDAGIAFPAWEQVNTDQMRRGTSSGPRPGMDHRVRLNDEAPTALEYLDALRRGFAIAYRCFLSSREELSTDEAVRTALSGLELRVLLRATRTYARLLLYLLQPNLLEDGIDRSIEIEWLARPVGVDWRSRARASVYETERRALEAQDVPRITTTMWDAVPRADEDRDLLALGDGRTPDTFYARLAELSETDLEDQLAIITRAVVERFASEDSHRPR